MQISTETQIYPKSIFLFGTSYKKLALQERELLTIVEKNESKLLSQLKDIAKADELALISTCNRFEIVAVNSKTSLDSELKGRVLTFFAEKLGKELKEDDFYCYDNRMAVRHFFSVTASLDSMVLGEAQILGQIKDSYRKAIDNGLAGKFLHHLFQFSFHLAKKVRSNTEIAQRGVSLSYVAVKLAEQIFEDLSGRSVLIIGSGQMAELAALHLKTHGATEVIVANRTLEKAIELANKIEASAISLNDIPNMLNRVDVIISSLSQVDKPLFTSQDVVKSKRNKDLFLVDLGVPRNLSPELASHDGVYLYNIDDLSKISDEHKKVREEAAKEAQILIDFGMVQFEKWLTKIAREPAVLELRSQVEAICKDEVSRLLGNLIPASEKKAILEELSKRISNKVSHHLMRDSKNQQIDTQKVLQLILDEFKGMV